MTEPQAADAPRRCLGALATIYPAQSLDSGTGAVMVPKCAPSAYVQSSRGVHRGSQYSHGYNSTRFTYKHGVPALVGGNRGFAFAPDLTVTSRILELLDSVPIERREVFA